ncbi:MAG TPA: AbrB family transcriptional regulator [Patescibacteria group bacterium]|nr:AbrB family transcriptional regulator [Patescibacteria group bacterium]
MMLVLRTLETFIVALLGGALFALLHLPLPWTLGPMAAVILWSEIRHRPVIWPIQLRQAGMVALGYVMGSPFTPEAGRQIWGQLPIMATATGLTVAFSLIMGWFTARQTGISLPSALLGSVPGGLSQMAVLCEEIPGTDRAVVTIMQTIRVLSVVFFVPFLALHGLAGDNGVNVAAALGQSAAATWEVTAIFGLAVVLGVAISFRLRLPTPFMLGPVLGTAAVGLSGLPAPHLPAGIVVAAQLLVGAYMGSGIRLDNLRQMKALLPSVLLGVAGILGCSLALGYGLSVLTGCSVVTGFLSTAPGGIGEMGLTAILVGADLSTVITYQLFRLLTILLVVPAVLKWLLRQADRVAG